MAEARALLRVVFGLLCDTKEQVGGGVGGRWGPVLVGVV